MSCLLGKKVRMSLMIISALNIPSLEIQTLPLLKNDTSFITCH